MDGIQGAEERLRAVDTYFKKMYPAWAELYDDTKGNIPALLPPLTMSVAEQYLSQRGLLAYDLRPARKTASYIEPELVYVPAGSFLMGSGEWDKAAADIEKPQHRLHLPAYWIGRFPVTNEEYRCFLLANPNHQKPRSWRKNEFPDGQKLHPVSNIYPYDAVAYCRWLSKVSRKDYTLPSEAEWEKAARGTGGRIYPWGNTFDKSRCNTSESHIGGTTPVERYSPRGDSPYGCADMSGNVYECTRSLWGKDWRVPEYGYPYNPADGREILEAPTKILNVLRGGAFELPRRRVRCASRDMDYPKVPNIIGFRVVLVEEEP